MSPVLELHGRAMRHSVVVVSQIHDDQWDLPTPCAGWTLRDLLSHMTTENHGFAAAARGSRAPGTPTSSATIPAATTPCRPTRC